MHPNFKKTKSFPTHYQLSIACKVIERDLQLQSSKTAIGGHEESQALIEIEESPEVKPVTSHKAQDAGNSVFENEHDDHVAINLTPEFERLALLDPAVGSIQETPVICDPKWLTTLQV